MKKHVTSERELISRIEKRLPSHAGGLLGLGIGEDAAVLRPRRGRELVVTCDFLIEGRHFLLDSNSSDSADAIGWKSLARATSDIAAMGGEARCFLLSLALPRRLTGEWLDEFLGGMARAARRFGMVVAGGDTTVHEKVIVNMTVVGEVRAGRAITRAGARPGDLICVSGRLGEAQLGLELMREGVRRRKGRNLPNQGRRSDPALQKHLYPEPRLALGRWLAATRLATAMIDTSDGLSSDLAHICEASGVGARIFAEKLPAVQAPAKRAKRALEGRRDHPREAIEMLNLALHGGEDYELLFTVPPRSANRLPRKYLDIPLTIVGEVTLNKEVEVINWAGRRPLIARGWDPLRKRVFPRTIKEEGRE